jgi:ABC-type amino acid transport system permease subunit
MRDPTFPPSPEDATPFFRGLRARIVATIGILVGGLCWIILYLAFLAGKFPWYQNLAIVLVSFVAIPTVVVVMWILWGISVGRRVHSAFWRDQFP